ncbi:Non-specific lipid-transfer protein 8 [Acorus calamus]|uniref:Non-specific lipid-transfer protein n=1 Tax=Acorus calamus TaxID=4465 RepID=A0AAV9DNK9_ACOCL|nr:Non-specific lipid-transfer protein 8 [Acorus calamus]
MARLAIPAAAVAALLVILPVAISAFDCGSAIQQLVPCLPYVTDGSDSPSTNCCNGIKTVANMVKDRGDRQTLCECLVKDKDKIPNLDMRRIQGLPANCGVQVDFPIGPNINCST